MKKSLLFGLLAVLAVVLIFTGCDNGTTTESSSGFPAQTNDATANDVATLGFAGTVVASSAPGVATVTITDGNIVITSASEGTADITVSIPYLTTATIPVTVDAAGDITIGTIVKGVDPQVDGTVTDNASWSTAGLSVASKVAGTNYLITVTGTIAVADQGKYDSGTALIDLYGPGGIKGGTVWADFAAIGLDGILVSTGDNDALCHNMAIPTLYSVLLDNKNFDLGNGKSEQENFDNGDFGVDYPDADDWLMFLLNKTLDPAIATIKVNGKNYTVEYSGVVWATE